VLIEAILLKLNRLPFVNTKEFLVLTCGCRELMSNGQPILLEMQLLSVRGAPDKLRSNEVQLVNETLLLVEQLEKVLLISNDQSFRQDAAAHREARNLSYQQRDFEERFEVDEDAAQLKFRSMSGLKHLYNAKWKEVEFMAEREEQLQGLAATKER
jgi:hypothetical protein